MRELLRDWLDTLRTIDQRGLLEIALLAIIIYALLRLARGTTGMSVLRGIAILVAALWLLSQLLDLTVLRWLVSRSVTGLAVAAPIIFQPEIRRALERVGRARVAGLRTRPEVEALIDAIARGCRVLAGQRHGALMVIERETGLEDYIANGRRVEAAVTEEILANVFYRNAPLHDGAVIIRGTRIVAAGCTLPLTDAQMDGHVGTRHKAGIGITERTDAVSVIVSEETGDISIASNGRMVSKLDDAKLRSLLASLLGQESGPRPGKRRRAASMWSFGRGVESEAAG
jgi:diadenylate cyclase